MRRIVHPEYEVRSKKMGLTIEVEYIPGPLSLELGLEREIELTHNVLLDGGEQNILDTWLRNTNIPPAFWLGLHSGDLGETATLANVVEPTQGGYGRKQIARSTGGWPTNALDAGDYQASAAAVTFESQETSWLQTNRVFLASTQTGAIGPVFLEAPMSVARILASQDTLQVTLRVKAQ